MIPPRLQRPGPLGDTTMIDLIESEQERNLSAVARITESGDHKTPVQRLEEYEAKGKNRGPGQLSFATSPLSERRKFLTADKTIEANSDRPGSSFHPSNLNRQGQPLSVPSHASQVSLHSRPPYEITSERGLLRFGTLAERDTETMADRRRRLLALDKSPEGAYQQKLSSIPRRQAKSLKISNSSGHRYEGTAPTIMPRGLPLVNIPEETSSSASLGSAREIEALPPSSWPTGLSRLKYQEDKHGSIRSGRSTSSGSDLEFASSSSSSGKKDLTPTSSLEKLTKSRNPVESVERASRSDWLPEIETCGRCGLFHEFSSRDDMEVPPCLETKSEGRASEIDPMEFSPEQGPVHEEANRERQLMDHHETGTRKRSRSFSSAETLLRIHSRRES